MNVPRRASGRRQTDDEARALMTPRTRDHSRDARTIAARIASSVPLQSGAASVDRRCMVIVLLANPTGVVRLGEVPHRGQFMFSSLGVVALALVPVYLTYRVWQHYGY